MDPVLTHFHHEFAFIVKMLQLSRITNHLPGIQPMGFNQPPYSSGEIPVCFLHFKNRSEAPQTEAPVSVASRFLAPRWRRRSDTHTHTHLHPCPRTPVLFFGPCSLAPDWLFASSKDPTITRPCRTPAPHEKQLMCSRGSIHLSGLPIRRRSAFFLLFFTSDSLCNWFALIRVRNNEVPHVWRQRRRNESKEPPESLISIKWLFGFTSPRWEPRRPTPPPDEGAASAAAVHSAARRRFNQARYTNSWWGAATHT